jgi:N-acetylglucosamine malate deacetylase 2
MRILYIFPHPDDESFGPSGAIAMQRRDGHEVFLLTLTRGGATKQRHRLGLSVAEMGAVRLEELKQVERVLDLNGLTVLDLPDSELKELDPREIESAVEQEIGRRRPDVIVTYAAHGVSGFQDHLVTHAVVKRVFVEMTSSGAEWLKRLALYTVADTNPMLQESRFNLKTSTAEEIDCIVTLDDAARDTMRRALDCYTTYRETIAESGVLEIAGETVPFEIFAESHDPPLDDLFDGLE